jgi:hypothetical protein
MGRKIKMSEILRGCCYISGFELFENCDWVLLVSSEFVLAP